MNYNNLFQLLKRRLEQTLPGVLAQEKMASSMRSTLHLAEFPDEQTRLSAVLILFYPWQEQIYIPMIVRPIYKGIHSGQVAFPGGRKEESDQTFIDTALRETYEEIGVIPQAVETLGMLSPLFVPASNFMVYPVVGATNTRPDFVLDPREVAQLVEVPLAELQDVGRIGFKEITVGENIKVQAPFYHVQEQTLWGASAMIMSELLAVLEEITL